MNTSPRDMSDQELIATLTALYAAQDAGKNPPIYRLCGAAFTANELDVIRADEHHDFLLTGRPAQLLGRVHDCQHIAPAPAPQA